MRYAFIKYFDKSKVVILIVYCIYLSFTLISIYIPFSLDVKMFNGTLTDQSISSLISILSFTMSILILYQYINEIKDNNFSLYICYSKSPKYVLTDFVYTWTLSLLIFGSLGILLVGGFHNITNSEYLSSYGFLEIMYSGITGTFFYSLFSFFLCFIIEKYLISFILIVIIKVIENIIYLRYFIKTSDDIILYLPLNGTTKIKYFHQHTECILPLLYISIILLILYLIIKKHFKKPEIRIDRAGI